MEEILAAHAARYPEMEPQDYGKLVYQSCFGPEHMISGPEQVEKRILEEWHSLERPCSPKKVEPIGGGLCRFPLSLLRDETDAAVLALLFAATARVHTKREENFADALAKLRQQNIPGMARWLGEYEDSGCPPVRHSESFRRAYHPHYRLLKWEYTRFFPIFREIVELLQQKRPAILAIDGRCGSGKTSLGRMLEEVFACSLVHMDDYYLPFEKRSQNWMEIPGGNMDLERFRAEVLEPFKHGAAIHYRPYCCQKGTMGEERLLSNPVFLVVEGSYSQHPMLREYYDRTIFLTCEKEEQIRRLQQREGDYFSRFQEIWMPLEERYFQTFAIEAHANRILDTGREELVCTKPLSRR